MTQPDWSIQVPWADVNNPPESSQTVENHSERLIDLREHFIEMILREVIEAVVGFFSPSSPAFNQLREWAEELPIIGEIIDLINRLLSPFGSNDSFPDLATALNQLVLTLTQPFQMIDGLSDFLEDITTDMFGRLGSIEARLNAMNLSLDSSVTETGGYDNCKTAANFTAVTGYPALTPTGWGALTSSSRAVAHYTSSPETDRHGAGIRVKSKTIGATRLHIAAHVDMTSFVALELNVIGNGKDTVSVVTAADPNGPFVTHKSITMRIPSESFWEIRYEPFDEDSVTSNTFHIFMNGDPVLPLRWKDDGNVVIHDSSHRRVGVTLNSLDHPTRRGFAITDFTYYDWLAAAPE